MAAVVLLAGMHLVGAPRAAIVGPAGHKTTVAGTGPGEGLAGFAVAVAVRGDGAVLVGTTAVAARVGVAGRRRAGRDGHGGWLVFARTQQPQPEQDVVEVRDHAGDRVDIGLILRRLAPLKRGQLVLELLYLIQRRRDRSSYVVDIAGTHASERLRRVVDNVQTLIQLVA